MSVEEYVKSIDKRLELLVKIAALQLGKDMTATERIIILHKIGLKELEISDILGADPHVVQVRLSEARKKGEIKKQ